MNIPTFIQVTFKSKDGLDITADLYQADNPRGFILLCHRSHFNRGEYHEIAPKLVKMSYSCLAIDQRSGMNVLGVTNETSSLAKKKNLPTGYLDAKQDIEAAIDYSYHRNGDKPIIIFGSSYSASLALLISVGNDRIKAVVAFSPGEYLKNTDLALSIRDLKKPIYVTSSKKEIKDTLKLMRFVNPKYITHFKPKVEGGHGSRVLWNKIAGNLEYGNSLTAFLNSL